MANMRFYCATLGIDLSLDYILNINGEFSFTRFDESCHQISSHLISSLNLSQTDPILFKVYNDKGRQFLSREYYLDGRASGKNLITKLALEFSTWSEASLFLKENNITVISQDDVLAERNRLINFGILKK